MARAILDELDQPGVLRAYRAQLVHDGAQAFDHLQIDALGTAANVIRFPHLAALQYQFDAATVVLDIQPVTYVLPVAINRQWKYR